MSGIYLITSSTENLKPLGDAVERYDLLVRELEGRLGSEHARLLSEPIMAHKGHKTWYSNINGRSEHLSTLVDVDQENILNRFQTLKTDIQNLADQLEGSKSSAERDLAETLRFAVSIPNENCIFAVYPEDGSEIQPVLINWGCERDESLKITPEKFVGTPKDPLVPTKIRAGRPGLFRGFRKITKPTPEPVTESETKSIIIRYWWWPFGLLWLLLLILIGYTFLLLIPPCGLNLGTAFDFCPKYGEALAAAEAKQDSLLREIAQLEDALAEKNQQCTPRFPNGNQGSSGGRSEGGIIGGSGGSGGDGGFGGSGGVGESSGGGFGSGSGGSGGASGGTGGGGADTGSAGSGGGGGGKGSDAGDSGNGDSTQEQSGLGSGEDATVGSGASGSGNGSGDSNSGELSQDNGDSSSSASGNESGSANGTSNGDSKEGDGGGGSKSGESVEEESGAGGGDGIGNQDQVGTGEPENGSTSPNEDPELDSSPGESSGDNQDSKTNGNEPITDEPTGNGESPQSEEESPQGSENDPDAEGQSENDSENSQEDTSSGETADQAEAPSLEEVEERLEQVAAGEGVLTSSLAWNTNSDLDLAIVCPDNRKINYKEIGPHGFNCDGTLDVDANNITSNIVPKPVENIYFNSLVAGTYEIVVTMYKNRNNDSPVEFTLRVNYLDNTEVFQQSLKLKGETWSHRITVEGKNE